jgi:hypothetical protein
VRHHDHKRSLPPLQQHLIPHLLITNMETSPDPSLLPTPLADPVFSGPLLLDSWFLVSFLLSTAVCFVVLILIGIAFSREIIDSTSNPQNLLVSVAHDIFVIQVATFIRFYLWVERIMDSINAGTIVALTFIFTSINSAGLFATKASSALINETSNLLNKKALILKRLLRPKVPLGHRRLEWVCVSTLDQILQKETSDRVV